MAIIRRDFVHASVGVLAAPPPSFRRQANSGFASVVRPILGEHTLTLEQAIDPAGAMIVWGPRALAPGFMLFFSFTNPTTIRVLFTALPAEGGTEGDYDITVLRNAP